jgi:DNA recombination protein RmuC
VTLSADSLVIAGIAMLLLVAGLIGAILVAQRRRHALNTELQVLATRLKSEDAIASEREAAVLQAEQRLAATFSRVASESLSVSGETFLRLAQENLSKHHVSAAADLSERQKAIETLVQPIQEALSKAANQIAEIEKARLDSFGSIRTQLASMTVGQQELQQETRNLVNALRRPQVRGQWGELTLRRVVELAGMVEHCDFIEQATVSSEDGRMRPDMIVRLPERGEIVVDVKTPLDAYLEAVEAKTDSERQVALQRHARNVADRIRELSAKAYWSQFRQSPEFVVLFIPGDQFLSAAVSENPALLEDALRQKVVLATPTSLVALLKAVAYGWREVSLARNAEEIRVLAVEMYERLVPFTEHLGKLGRSLEGTVKTFNDAVGSLEHMVLPSARKLTELGVRGKRPMENIAEVGAGVRSVQPIGISGPVTSTQPEPTADPDDPRPH